MVPASNVFHCRWMDSPVAKLLVSSNQLLWLVGKSPSNALILFPYIYTSIYVYIYSNDYMPIVLGISQRPAIFDDRLRVVEISGLA
jgi:hypothetical protein